MKPICVPTISRGRSLVGVGLTLLLTVVITFAQNPPLKFVFGTVSAISGNQIFVQSDLQVVTLSVDDRTEVWKGTVFHGLSAVSVGDDISAQYRTDASENLVANVIRLNGVNFSAVITKPTSGGFEVFTNPNADPQSAYKKEYKMVVVDADTIFEESAHEDVKVGRDVQVMGVDLKNGKVLATRITVYEGKRPVRMGRERVILPNGQVR